MDDEKENALPHPADLSEVKKQLLDLAYGTVSPSQKQDLFLPEGKGPFPVILFIHGGAFMMCDKRDSQVQPWLRALDRGFAVATINYRMSGEALFPAAVHDCKCALRWLRAHSGRYGLDPNRIASVGPSAGGNLSALLATSAGVPELEGSDLGCADQSSAVQACIDWFGPTDFLLMDHQLAERGLGPCDHNFADSPESRYMGGQITKLDEKYVQRANPMTYIGKDLPPLLIQHGDRDHLVCVGQSEIFARAVEEKLGPGRVVFEILEGADHADGPYFETESNMDRNLRFLEDYLM